MKTLYLVRHAKAVRQSDIPDADRPLDEQGKRDAALIAERLKGGAVPDGLVSSPAERALQTAGIFAGVFGYPADKIMKRKLLYDQTDSAFRTVIREMDERYERIVLFGHNPSITAYARALAPDFHDEIPVCGVVGIEVDAKSWKDVVAGKGRVVRMEYPGRDTKNESSGRLKKELAAEIADAVNRTLAMHGEEVAVDLRENSRRAAKKLAGKFAKRLRKRGKSANRERN